MQLNWVGMVEHGMSKDAC